MGVIPAYSIGLLSTTCGYLQIGHPVKRWFLFTLSKAKAKEIINIDLFAEVLKIYLKDVNCM